MSGSADFYYFSFDGVSLWDYTRDIGDIPPISVGASVPVASVDTFRSQKYRFQPKDAMHIQSMEEIAAASKERQCDRRVAWKSGHS